MGLKQGEHPLPPLVPPVPADGRGSHQQLQQLPRQVSHPYCSPAARKAMFVSEKFPHLAAYHPPTCPALAQSADSPLVWTGLALADVA